MTTSIIGAPAAPGIAVGAVWRHRPRVGGMVSGAVVRATRASDPIARIHEAGLGAARQLDVLAERLREQGRAAEAEMIHAQALLAVDPDLIDEAVALAAEGHDPVSAVLASAETSARLLDLEAAPLAARAADLRDVAARLARILSGAHLELPDAPCVVVGDDLPPSLLAEIPRGVVLGVALVGGTPGTGATLVARHLGVPAVVCAVGLMDVARLGVQIAIDGETGEVTVNPTPADLQLLADRQAARQERDRRAASER
jgi:phosphoenolpyruvate-protein kinase (PTS system EI component)